MFIRIMALGAIACLAMVADTLVLKTGRSVEGTYLGGDARTIRLNVGDRVESYPVADVESIRFSSGEAAAPASAAAPARTEQAAPAQSADSTSGFPARTAGQQQGPATGTELPAGTTITVRMIDSVDSTRDKMGQTFRASLDEPIMMNGEPVIQRGADVLLKLVDSKQSGKIQGQTELTLDVVSMSVNGRTVDLNTTEVTQASSSRGAKSAKVIGGTAAVGTIIGAIAGGGKGAAIGGLAGAGAGTAAQTITKGQQVKIPSETRLTFSLESPVRL